MHDPAPLPVSGRGWNKALDAIEHPDPVVRARESADLEWWVRGVRQALETV